MSSSAERLRDWFSPPNTHQRGYRFSLDSYGLKKSEEPPSTVSKQTDLESQSSSPSKEKKASSRSPSVAGSQRSRTSSSMIQKLRAWKPSKEILYNAVLGTSDGMTVPFAVTASLAGVADARLVMMAGLAELIAGSISMAAGGVLGARSEV